MPSRVVKVHPTKPVTIKLKPSKSGGAMRVDLSGSGVNPAPKKRGPSMKRGGALRAL